MNLNYWSGGSPVSMGEILDARESRAAIQKEMLKRNPGCLVCLTLNIPGPVKTFPFVRWLYEVGTGKLLETAELLSPYCKQAADQKLPDCMQEFREVKENTGYECFACLDLDPQTVKAALTHFEETHPVGRLFDFDVLRPDGTKVSPGTGLSPADLPFMRLTFLPLRALPQTLCPGTSGERAFPDGTLFHRTDVCPSGTADAESPAL